MSFRCATTPAGQDLCFNGGVCAPDKSQCLCQVGWSHDYTFFHDPNCTLADSAYLYALIASSVTTAGCFVLLARKFGSSRGEIRNLILLAVAFVACLWFMLLAMFLESGFFRVSIAFQILSGIPLNIFTGKALNIIISPLFVMSTVFPRKRAIFLAYSYLAFMYTSNVTAQIAMIATANDSDPTVFNRAAVAFFFLLSSTLIGVLAILERGTIKLLKTIRKSQHLGADSERLCSKLESIRRIGLAQIPGTIFANLIWPIVHLVLGSFREFSFHPIRAKRCASVFIY